RQRLRCHRRGQSVPRRPPGFPGPGGEYCAAGARASLAAHAGRRQDLRAHAGREMPGGAGQAGAPSAWPSPPGRPGGSIRRASPLPKEPRAPTGLRANWAPRRETALTGWVRQEGLDIISAHYVPNLRTVALKPWARRGGKGVFINHEASRTSNDCYVCEIASGGKLAPQRQLYEEMILTLDGRGSTTVWN